MGVNLNAPPGLGLGMTQDDDIFLNSNNLKLPIFE